MIAQVVVSTEVAIGLAVTIVGSITGALVFVFKMLISSYEKQLAVLITDRDNWKQVSGEAVGNLRKAANAKRVRDGKEPYEDLADVIPEHNSPVTEEQRQTAELATVRAALVAATKDLNLPPREVSVSEKAVEVVVKAQEVVDKLVADKDALQPEDVSRELAELKEKEKKEQGKIERPLDLGESLDNGPK